jgi:hypothetical protein
MSTSRVKFISGDEIPKGFKVSGLTCQKCKAKINLENPIHMLFGSIQNQTNIGQDILLTWVVFCRNCTIKLQKYCNVK